MIASCVSDTCGRQQADHVDGILKEFAERQATKADDRVEFERIQEMPIEQLNAQLRADGVDHGVSGR